MHAPTVVRRPSRCPPRAATIARAARAIQPTTLCPAPSTSRFTCGFACCCCCCCCRSAVVDDGTHAAGENACCASPEGREGGASCACLPACLCPVPCKSPSWHHQPGSKHAPATPALRRHEGRRHRSPAAPLLPPPTRCAPHDVPPRPRAPPHILCPHRYELSTQLAYENMPHVGFHDHDKNYVAYEAVRGRGGGRVPG